MIVAILYYVCLHHIKDIGSNLPVLVCSNLGDGTIATNLLILTWSYLVVVHWYWWWVLGIDAGMGLSLEGLMVLES